MSDPGPRQQSLFSTAAKQSRGIKGGPAQPPTGPAAGAAAAARAGAAAEVPRPLLIGPAERGLIHALIERARQHPVLLDEMTRRANQLKRGIKPPANLNRQFSIRIPEGFTATYTHEEQPPPLNWTRHLSIAADRAGRAPHPVAVDWLMREFGFRAATLRELDAAWFEPLDNKRQAINLVEALVPIALVSDAGDSEYIVDDGEPRDEC
jgi:hypothetical protein